MTFLKNTENYRFQILLILYYKKIPTMNKFKNSYELIIDLVRNNLLSGFYLSSGRMYFDLDLETKIEDAKLLKHIDAICNSWMLENAKNAGFYNFIFEKY